MAQEEKKLFLLDAYALIFRAYYAFIKNPRLNSNGLNTSAVLGFMNSLMEVIQSQKPSHIGVCFDVGRETVRTEYFPEYKGTRDETPEGIKLAVPYIQKILEALNIPMLFLEGYEADDVVGTMVKQAEKEGFDSFMMTSDKDFAQLVTEKTKMYRPSVGGNKAEIWGIEEVKVKFGVNEPKQVIDFLGMMGDSVDNIPGLPGVGEKTAKKFIQEYGSMENLLENLGDIKGKLKEKIEAGKEIGLLSKKLATILVDLPIEFKPDELVISEPNWEEIQKLYDELEFRRLTENTKKVYQKIGLYKGEDIAEIADKQKIQSAQTDLFGSLSDETEEEEKVERSSHFYQYVDTEMGIKLMVKKLLQQKEVCFDCETTSLDTFEAELVGIAFSYEKDKGYYVVFPEEREKALLILNQLKPFFESDEILKIGHNLKYDLKVLRNYNLKAKGPFWDTMIAHYLLNPDSRHNMDLLSRIYLKHEPISIEYLIGKKGKNQKSFRTVSLEEQTEYAVEDADVTLQLKQIFDEGLKERELTALFSTLEMPLMEVLLEMELEGIKLDDIALKMQSDELAIEVISLEKRIYELSDSEFNINSPKQMGEILFDKLKIVDKPKKTKTGQYSTAEDVLEKLADKHEIVQKILEYRQIQKLKSTYLDALPEKINKKTGRVHTQFSQTVAATGRLASSDPNLQNIPIRTEAGRQVRKAFVAKNEDYLLMAADYSQIELRLIAALSGDESMITSFRNNEDIHTTTAAKVFDVALDEVTREQRGVAKTVNFGIIYGVSAFGLSEQTDLSRSEAKEMIDTYYENYPTLKTYMSNQVEIAREQGYVETILGRRRYLADINSGNHLVRSHAERNAVNAPIQGSAADIIKLAMIKIQKKLEENKMKSKLLLQVHDELVLDVCKEELDKVKELLIDCMENAYKIAVPLKVELGVATNWLEAH